MSGTWTVEGKRDGVLYLVGAHSVNGFTSFKLTEHAAEAIAAALNDVYGDGEFYIHEEQSQ